MTPESQRERQTDRRAVAPEAAASRTLPRSAPPAGRRAECAGTVARSGIERELEPGGELDRAQHAQAVVAERRGIDGAQQRALESARPSNGILIRRRVSGSQEMALTVKSRRRAASADRQVAGRR